MPRIFETNLTKNTLTLKVAVLGKVDADTFTNLFRDAGLKPETTFLCPGDSTDKYTVTFSSENEVLRAYAILLGMYSENDDEFCRHAKKLLSIFNVDQNLREHLSKDEHRAFVDVLKNKHQQLVAIFDELKELASKVGLTEIPNFSDLSDSSDITTLINRIDDLRKENKAFFDRISHHSRTLCSDYNETAVKAIIMAIANTYLQKERTDLLDVMNDSTEESTDFEVSQPATPTPLTELKEDQVYPYIEPEVRFKTSKSLYSDYIKKEDVERLSNTIDDLFEKKETAEGALDEILSFFRFIQATFVGLYNEIIDALKQLFSEDNPIKDSEDLAENVDNIVNGIDISDRAKKLHQYNSRPSPLIAVIHAPDTELNDEEKYDLLEKLSLAKPYHEADENRPDFLNIEISGGQPQCSNSKELEIIWERTPLQHAVQYGNFEQTKLLIRQGANLDARGQTYLEPIDGDNITALHLAVVKGDIDKVKLLVENGADVNALNKENQTPLHAASDQKIAAYLIEKGADINLADSKGNTPLHLAAKRNDLDVIKHLLQQKTIKVDSPNQNGDTPLSMAAYLGIGDQKDRYRFHAPEKMSQKCINNLQAMECLIKAGATVNHLNNHGYTPLLLAINMDKHCMGHGSKADTLTPGLAKAKVELLCQYGANVRIASKPSPNYDYGCNPTPEMTALQALYAENVLSDRISVGERKSIAEILIQHGADPKIKTKAAAQTLAHFCVYNKDPIGLEYFLETCRLDPNATDRDGKTPLDYVFRSSLVSDDNFKEKGKACIDLLIKHGANPTQSLPHESSEPRKGICHLEQPCSDAIKYIETLRANYSRNEEVQQTRPRGF